jgi:hypothetical protein
VFNFYVKGAVAVAASARILLETTAAAASVGQAFASYNISANGFVVDCYNGAGQNRAATFSTTTWLNPPYRFVFAGLMNRASGAMATDVLSRINGAANTTFSGSTDQTGNFSTSNLNLMGRDALGASTPTLLSYGTIEDVVIYTADSSANAAEIERILRDI